MKKFFSSILIPMIIANGITATLFTSNANAAITSTIPVNVSVAYPIAYSAGGNSYIAGELVNKPISSAGVKFKFTLTGPGLAGGSCFEEMTLPVTNGLLNYSLGSKYVNTGIGCDVTGLAFNSSYTVTVNGDLTEPSNGVYTDGEDYSSTTTYKSYTNDISLNSFLDSKTLSIQDAIYSKTLSLSGAVSGGSSSSSSSTTGGASAYQTAVASLSSTIASTGKAVRYFDINGDGQDDIFFSSPTATPNTIYGPVKVLGSTSGGGVSFIGTIPLVEGRNESLMTNVKFIGKFAVYMTTPYVISNPTIYWQNSCIARGMFDFSTTNTSIYTEDGTFANNPSSSQLLNPPYTLINTATCSPNNAYTSQSSFSTVGTLSGLMSNKYWFGYGNWDATSWSVKLRNPQGTAYYYENGGLKSKTVDISIFQDGITLTMDGQVYAYNATKDTYDLLGGPTGNGGYVTETANSPTFSAGNLNNTGALDIATYDSVTRAFTSVIDGTTSILSNIDGVYYADINGDSKLDIITYVISGTAKKYKVYLMSGTNQYNQILGGTDGVDGTVIKVGNSLTNNTISSRNVNDIIIYNNGTYSFYKINADELGVTNIGNKVASDIKIYGGSQYTTGTDGLLEDNNPANGNDKILVYLSSIGKIGSKSLTYYKFKIAKWNGTSIVDLESWIPGASSGVDFSPVGDSLVVKKGGTQDFYMFFVDQNDANTPNDYTSAYVINNGKVKPLIIDAKISGGGNALYKSFGIFDIPVVSSTARGGILSFNAPISSTQIYGGYSRYGLINYEVLSNGSVEENSTTAQGLDVNTSIVGNIPSNQGFLINIDRMYSSGDRTAVYNAISSAKWGFGNVITHSGSNAAVGATMPFTLTPGRNTIAQYTNLSTFTSQTGGSLIVAASYTGSNLATAGLGLISGSLANQAVINYGSNTANHTVNNLRSYTGTGFTQVNGYMWNDSSYGKTIYYDGNGIGFFNTADLKTNNASSGFVIPYLDITTQYGARSSLYGAGTGAIVFGNNSWNSTTQTLLRTSTASTSTTNTVWGYINGSLSGLNLLDSGSPNARNSTYSVNGVSLAQTPWTALSSVNHAKLKFFGTHNTGYNWYIDGVSWIYQIVFGYTTPTVAGSAYCYNTSVQHPNDGVSIPFRKVTAADLTSSIAPYSEGSYYTTNFPASYNYCTNMTGITNVNSIAVNFPFQMRPTAATQYQVAEYAFFPLF